jgi:hypothetical protein
VSKYISKPNREAYATEERNERKLFIIFSSFTGYSMSSAAVLKGRPIEMLPQISIWEYIETKVKNYTSKVAQVSFITCYDLHRFINYIQRAIRKKKKNKT